MSDNSVEECCCDAVLTQIDDEVFDIRIIVVILLSVIFVRIFDYISNKVNINFIEIMGNLFSRLTGNCSNPEEDNRSVHKSSSKTEPNAGSQGNVPEIRKHSSTPIATDTTPKQLKKTSAKPLLAKHSDKNTVNINKDKDKEINVQKEKPIYTTTFETQVDAAPPHPLEEKFQDIQLDEIEIDTNLFTPEVEDAVLKIQAGFRGYLARKHVNELKKDIEDSALINNVEEISVVPPPKNFENQKLGANNLDLDKWKKLSQHLEDKIIDGVDNQLTEVESNVQPIINGRLTEAVIPLKDSDDNKVIETYVCKENILDVEPNEEQTTDPTSLKITSEKVVERVFNVLLSETESEDLMNFVDTNKTKIESSVVEPIKEVNQIISDKLGKEITETAESEVLAKLNEILDSDSNVDNELTSTQESVNDESIKSKAVEIISQNTTQEIIRNSFHEFVKEMTSNQLISEEPVPELPKVPLEEPKVEEIKEESVEETKVEERKTDSKIFEEQVVQTIFDEELSKSQSQQQIFAIEVFKHDVNEEQLANVTTICEPEPTAKNMWGVEDSVVFKTSVDQFVVKPVVEPQTPTEPLEVAIPLSPVLDSPPLLDTEQKIEIITTESRKNSQDLLESEVNTIEEPFIQTMEVLPIPSPVIQIDESEQNGRPLDEEEAAIRIQAAFRGYQIRRSLSREASPNRGTGNNHNNIDNNNNNHNNTLNGNDIELNDNDVHWIESSLHTNNDLSNNSNQLEINYQLTTEQVSIDNQLITTAVEQIDTSLEKLEDQLMQELISSAEEEDRAEALLNDNLDTTQNIINEMNALSNELTAPLLLQRLQQSMSSNASNADPEEQIQEVELIQTYPETVPIDAQTEQTELKSELEDRPLIEKSDTIIDLMSTQRIINPIVDNNQIIGTNDNQITEDIIKDLKDIINENQIISSEVMTEEVLNESPFIISEILKESKPEPIEIITKLPLNLQSIPQTEQEQSEAPKSDPIIANLQEPIILTESEPIQVFETQINERVIQQENIEPPKQELIESLNVETSTPEPLSEPKPENIESSKPESNGVLEKLENINLEIRETAPEFETSVEPPTPSLDNATEITPELSFIQSSEQAILTKICSSESEQEVTEVMSSDKIIESRPSMIPVLESHMKSKSGEQKEFKRPKPILKESDPKIHTNLISDEHTHSTSEEISSPDDDNPEFVGLGPNTPIPVRASSPNPFGKKRRRGKKGTGARK